MTTYIPGPGEDGYAVDEQEAEYRLSHRDATLPFGENASDYLDAAGFPDAESETIRRERDRYLEQEDAVFERELRRSRDLDDGILYADDL